MSWPKGVPRKEITTEKIIQSLLKYRVSERPKEETFTQGIIHWAKMERKKHQGKMRFVVPVTCLVCGETRLRSFDNLSKSIKKPTFTGACFICATKGRKMKDHPGWRGGHIIHDHGYIGITTAPDHPFASMRNCRGEIYEHRLVMAQKLGRPLAIHEHVHHLNGIRNDNRPENLELVTTQQNNVIRFMEERIKILENILIEHKIPFPR